MNPSPEQIADFVCEFKAGLKPHETHLINGEMSPELQSQLRGYIRARTEQATEIAELKTWKDAVLDSLAVSCADCSIDTPPAEILKLVASINEGLLSEFHKAQIAELMPLAKFGAMVMHDLETRTTFDALDVWCLADIARVTADDKRGYAPNVEAAIEQLLKD
jgi:hypothetical protein